MALTPAQKAANNPLNAFATTTGTATNFRVPPLPSLRAEISANGFQGGIDSFDAKMQQWSQDLERILIQQFQSNAAISPGKVV